MERETESDFAADYEAHQTAQDAAYEAEYRRWVSSLSEADRQRLVADGLLEPCNCNIRASSTGGGGGEIDISLIPGGAGYEGDDCVPTIAAAIPEGTDFEQLRELGLSAAKAEAVLQWISRRQAAEINALAADRLARFFTLLLPATTAHKINLHLLGVRALAAHFLMNRNGTSTMTAMAERAKMSKQLLDHHVRAVGDALHFHGFGLKKESTRAVYSEAAKARWAALTAEERIARRHGVKGIIGTQSAPPAAQI